MRLGGKSGAEAARDSSPAPAAQTSAAAGPAEQDKTYSPREVTSKARIVWRPEPIYTETARRNEVTGTVVIRAVFSSSGQVTNVRVVSGLGDGLTENAVEAARSIRFFPAVKDGRVVSQYVQIEYNFNLY
jgi:TonB family protein